MVLSTEEVALREGGWDGMGADVVPAEKARSGKGPSSRQQSLTGAQGSTQRRTGTQVGKVDGACIRQDSSNGSN